MVMKARNSSKPDPRSPARTLPAGEFKAKCLQLIEDVKTGQGEVLITKRGKPAARLVPIEQPKEEFVPLWGRAPGIKILGDIITPLEWPDPAEKWARANATELKRKR